MLSPQAEASSQRSARDLGGRVLLGVLQGWDERTRKEHVLLGLGLWVPGGLMPFSGLKIVPLMWSGARARGSQAGQMGEGCLLEAA